MTGVPHPDDQAPVRRSRLATVVRTGVPVILIALGLSGQAVLSAQALLAAAAVWITGVLLVRLLGVASIAQLPMSAVFRRRSSPPPPATEHRGLRTTRLLVSEAMADPRATTVRLRPYLTALAAHHIPVRHGIRFDDRAGVAALLGDRAWLIDDDVTDRTATLDDIDGFLDIVLAAGDGRDRAEIARAGRTDT